MGSHTSFVVSAGQGTYKVECAALGPGQRKSGLGEPAALLLLELPHPCFLLGTIEGKVQANKGRGRGEWNFREAVFC